MMFSYQTVNGVKYSESNKMRQLYLLKPIQYTRHYQSTNNKMATYIVFHPIDVAVYRYLLQGPGAKPLTKPCDSRPVFPVK